MKLEDLTIDEQERAVDIMECQAGFKRHPGYLPSMDKYFCVLFTKPEDVIPVDCGFRGEILLRYRDMSKKDADYVCTYECRRNEE